MGTLTNNTGAGVYDSQKKANVSQEDDTALTAFEKAYNDAKAKGDKQGMANAHAGAEAIRAKNYFSGGADGSKYIEIPTAASKTFSNNGYVSPVATEIQKLVDSIGSSTFDYNPNKDENYQKYKQQMLDTADKAYSSSVAGASTPGIADSSMAQQIANTAKNEYLKSADNAASTYFDKAYQRYQDQLSNKYNQLSSLLGMDNTGYNRSQDALNRTDSINASQGYVNPTANVTVSDSVRQQLAPYANDYTAYANANPGTDLGNAARALANEKIFSNPTLLQKYGSNYKTSAQKAQDLQNEAQRISNQYAPQIAQGQIDSNKFENEYKRLRNLNYPEDEAAQRAAVYANISQGNAQIDISRQNANTNKAQLDWAMNPNNPDNMYKVAQINSATGKVNSNTTFTIDDWGKVLDNEFLPKRDSTGYVVEQGVTDPNAREKRILELGLPTDMTKALYQRYGIQLPK